MPVRAISVVGHDLRGGLVYACPWSMDRVDKVTKAVQPVRLFGSSRWGLGTWGWIQTVVCD